MTPSQFFEYCKKNNVEMMDLKFVDLLGSWQHCSYPVSILDEDTFLATHATLDRARRTGRDPVEELHRHGLLLAPVRRRQIQVMTLIAFEQELTRWRPHEFLRRIRKVETSTPADMHEAIHGYLLDYIKTLKEER